MKHPVITIPVYKRIEHLKKCIESLQKNSIAKDSILYIYSDYPKPSDVDTVDRLRRYLKEITGFYKVIIHEQTENKNLFNIVEAIEEPLKEHGQIIYLEEDLEVSSNFLDIMNNALAYYSKNNNVFSISGYSLPCFKDKNTFNFLSSDSFTAWGCGLWYSKYVEYKKYMSDKNIIQRLNESLVRRIQFIKKHSLHQYLHYLEKSKSNKLTPDLSMGFYIWDQKKIQIFPSNSFVSTNGFDGSGWHCGIDNRYHDELLEKKNIGNIFFRDSFTIQETEYNFSKIKKFHNLNYMRDIKSLIKFSLRELKQVKYN